VLTTTYSTSKLELNEYKTILVISSGNVPLKLLPVTLGLENIREDSGRHSILQLSLLDEVNETANEDDVSKLEILTYFILLDGKVPAPGSTPLTLIKSIEVVGGSVTILLSTLVISFKVKKVSFKVFIPLTICSSLIFMWKVVGVSVDAMLFLL
jgi:hypothetical protein